MKGKILVTMTAVQERTAGQHRSLRYFLEWRWSEGRVWRKLALPALERA
ncbi:hypothetical protein [Bradyrhizobium ivorense]|nr:hypothetical protein [Bradyrhizobium ivorense]